MIQVIKAIIKTITSTINCPFAAFPKGSFILFIFISKIFDQFIIRPSYSPKAISLIVSCLEIKISTHI